MEESRVKEILAAQLELLSENSKKCFDETLVRISLAMCEVAKLLIDKIS